MATPQLEEDSVFIVELARKDKERLQGRWSFVSGTREAQMEILGDHFTIHFKNGETYIGTFVLHSTRKPKAVDMVITEGPDRYKGKTALAIYALDGQHLIWSPARPGLGERPAFFPLAEDKEHLCVVFHHDK